ncbi:MAG: mechanosensitive ion channel family protein [Polyangiaceae bacterium]
MESSAGPLLRAALGPVVLLVIVVTTAFVVGRFAPQKRALLRRTVVLLLLYFLATGLLMLLPWLGTRSWVGPMEVGTNLLAAVTAVSLAGLVAFDLILPALRVNLATIVADLTIGLAYVVAVMLVIRRAGVDLTGIVATSAVVTGILALSMQATLGNVIGGVALQLDKSIRVGDWIQLENGRQGRVAEIRWRHTVVETRDWDTIIVPNGSLLAANIIILGKREGAARQHRMVVHFNVDFRHPPADVIRAVEAALQAAPIEGVAADPPPTCTCKNLAGENRNSFAFYAVWYWLTDLARDERADSRVRERVFAALQRASIRLAVPATHIWMEQDSEERRERKAHRDVETRRQAVDHVELLRPLVGDERTSIAEHLRFTPFAAGEVITHEGSVAHWLYILDKGAVEVTVAASDGAEKVVARLEAPDFFGEMGLMTGEPRTASVRAVTDVVCFRLDKGAFHDIVAGRPEVAAEISQMLAQRKVELAAAREDLDAGAKQRRVAAEQKRILGTIQGFFGLDT